MEVSINPLQEIAIRILHSFPLAMPIMFGPGVLATVLGMTSLKSSTEEIFSMLMIAAAAILCMAVIYLTLAYADTIVKRIGKKGIDAATRIVDFLWQQWEWV